MAATKRTSAYATAGLTTFRTGTPIPHRAAAAQRPAYVPPQEDEDEDIPVWLHNRRGGGSSGAPAAPAPAPSRHPHSRGQEADDPTSILAHPLPWGETRATFPAGEPRMSPEHSALPRHKQRRTR